ncbi:MAG: hypothetical protein IPL24_05425 [Bacteroidetes bacterium]|nr:hypothetical protein [Bacteroidota bacterium]
MGNFISVTPATPASSSTASIVTANNSIASATDIPTGTIYTFTPPALRYSWSPTTNLTGSTTADPTITGLTSTTTYTVTATGAGGCTGTATVTLTVQPTVADPTVTATPSGTVCPGTSVLLDAGAGYTNYLWSNGATTQTTTVTPSATTTYTVIVDNGPSSCSASGSITVNTFTVATASIVDPGPFCTPGSATLSVTPSFSSYLWSTTATTPTISISTGGLYSVTVTDANGCSQTASFTAVSNPFPPTAVITSSGGYSLCWDGVTPASITLTADITGADPGSTIQWFDENFSTTPSITLTSTSTDFVNISNPLVLLFNVTSPAGCVTTSNVVSVANDITPIITSLSATTGCNGDVITITGSAFTGELFTGPSAILFNGTPAPSFTFVDDNTITVTVPAGATTGPITVVSGAGNCTAVSGTFTVACGSPMTINLTAYLQGYYLGAGTMQPVLANQFVPGATGAETDTITVEIYDASTFLLAGSAKAVLMTDGSATAVVYGSDGQYYIAIRHRNSILTWSSVDIALATATPASYDFSSSLANVFSGWMADDFSEGIYSIFTGDINQDEFVDAADFPQYDNDNAAGACCDYYVTDLNGDGFVDAADFPSYDNNNSAGVFSIHP